MRPRLILALAMAVVVGLAQPGQARAASFDCAKAAHPLEHVLCDNPDLSRQDEAMAAAYREALAIRFDKVSLRAVQRDWQRRLRQSCAAACAAPDVARAYADRLATLRYSREENWQANYKTGDAEDLVIDHLDPAGGQARFRFSLRRYMLDTPDDAPLCLLDPRDDAPVARHSSPTRAAWSDGKDCTIDFTLRRQADGHVPSIDIAAGPQCRHYCGDSGYTLADSNFIPENPVSLPEE